MGNCASVQKDHDSAVKLNFSVTSKTPDPGSFLVESAVSSLKQVAAHQSSSRMACFDDPSKDGDVFFDSQPWLDSDCEDYFSVYDETPSHTPIHPSIHIEKTTDSIPETPSTGPRKQLIELLREGLDSSPVLGSLASQAVPRTPGPVDCPTILYDGANNSGWSSEVTPNSKPLKVKSSESSPCCLPNLVRNLSFNERRKRVSHGHSPAAHSVEV